jgi:hypothetical protein
MFLRSFCPSKKEIAYARQFEFPDALIKEIPENIEDKLREVRSKIVYGLMSENSSWNRTVATESFNLYWYRLTNNMPKDVKEIIEDFWKDFK